MAWLMGFDKPRKNAYEKAGYELGKDFGNYIEVKNKLDGVTKTTEYEDLKEIRRLAEGISYKPLRQELLPLADQKLEQAGKDLARLTEERRQTRLKEEAEERRQIVINKRREEIQRDLEEINSVSDIRRIERRIENLGDETDISDLKGQIKGIEKSLEEQRELLIQETRRNQEESNQRKEELRRQGMEPDF